MSTENNQKKALNKTDVSNSTFYEYGSMSSKYRLEANNKFTAYATMIFHYKDSAHLIAIYEPKECKDDSWMSFTGTISDRLDEIFGGVGSFDNYIKNNIEDIKKSYKSIERIV